MQWWSRLKSCVMASFELLINNDCVLVASRAMHLIKVSYA